MCNPLHLLSALTVILAVNGAVIPVVNNPIHDDVVLESRSVLPESHEVHMERRAPGYGTPGSFWGSQGPSMNPQGQSWGPQGQSWGPQGQAWRPQGQSWGPQGQSWGPQGQSWGPQRPFMNPQGPLMGPLGPIKPPSVISAQQLRGTPGLLSSNFGTTGGQFPR
ncbi:hypothetical protein BASA50_009574 [Batrachochytrium salamandrivorans]|uniref:Uncharacterized protein n=1 Tax=Batrachochytrium salamandrivorans TaxID=1357716 RepID=A0ABQ8F0X6_9FUNG|nr:hypothetical protein BASA62_005225 [Batrachochytrium salamandrivorans]KAH6576622.1 hypothetical protein BASA62_001316 [Batrachochytrium salamandrivorans]KAH6583335.1 hypothetical protein BASA61_008045 [Batrachochytrium salamandrivorans]KAH6583695.1 hypothetical protein BASA60_001340 [Batrachochytrium salamandrivorans]KAH6584364.1 hypothetical protein BASA61_007529 [Batrachochytrium salamandrivorans]